MVNFWLVIPHSYTFLNKSSLLEVLYINPQVYLYSEDLRIYLHYECQETMPSIRQR